MNIQPSENNLIFQLNEQISKETLWRSLPVRCFHSIKAITLKKGVIKGALSGVILTAATVYGTVFSYFCLEGAARSLMEVALDDTPIVRLRPLGDVGGWVALALFSALTIKSLCHKFTGEGEYLRLQTICERWVKENKEIIQANPDRFRYLYEKFLSLLDDFNSHCIFSKPLVSRRLTALKMVEDLPGLEEKSSKLSKDRALQDIFVDVQTKLEKKTSLQQSCNRLFDGAKSFTVYKTGKLRGLISLITVTAFAVFLFMCAVVSIVGEVGLAKEIFGDREELTDTGHLGEWPMNIVEALGVAFFLIWSMMNEGDFARTRKVYAKQIKALEDEEDQNLRKRLCQLGNRELFEQSQGCYYSKTSYQFEKL